MLVPGTCCCFLVLCRCSLVPQRSKWPSAQALEALVSSPPQRVRRQSLVLDGSSSSSTQQPPAATATDLDQPAVLPSPVMDQLVSRVTEEVTKRLQPLLSNLGSLAQPAQSPPSTSSQAPAVSLPVEQSTFLQSSGPNIRQAQGHAAIQDTVEAPAVHDGVQSVLAPPCQLQIFKQLAPAYVHRAPTVIPPHLQLLSWLP